MKNNIRLNNRRIILLTKSLISIKYSDKIKKEQE